MPCVKELKRFLQALVIHIEAAEDLLDLNKGLLEAGLESGHGNVFSYLTWFLCTEESLMDNNSQVASPCRYFAQWIFVRWNHEKREENKCSHGNLLSFTLQRRYFCGILWHSLFSQPCRENALGPCACIPRNPWLTANTRQKRNTWLWRLSSSSWRIRREARPHAFVTKTRWAWNQPFPQNVAKILSKKFCLIHNWGGTIPSPFSAIIYFSVCFPEYVKLNIIRLGMLPCMGRETGWNEAYSNT